MAPNQLAANNSETDALITRPPLFTHNYNNNKHIYIVSLIEAFNILSTRNGSLNNGKFNVVIVHTLQSSKIRALIS